MKKFEYCKRFDIFSILLMCLCFVQTADSHALTIEEQKTEMSQYVHVPVNCACQTVRVQNSQSKKADSNLISLLQSRLENSNKSLLERQEQVEKLIGTKGEVEVFNQNLKDKIRRLEDDLVRD